MKYNLWKHVRKPHQRSHERRGTFWNSTSEYIYNRHEIAIHTFIINTFIEVMPPRDRYLDVVRGLKPTQKNAVRLALSRRGNATSWTELSGRMWHDDVIDDIIRAHLSTGMPPLINCQIHKTCQFVARMPKARNQPQKYKHHASKDSVPSGVPGKNVIGSW